MGVLSSLIMKIITGKMMGVWGLLPLLDVTEIVGIIITL